MNKEQKKKLLTISYLAVIAYSIHYYSLYYILSNFLNEYFSRGTLSILFAVASFSCIVLSNFFGKILSKFSNKKSLNFFILSQILITFSLSFAGSINLYIIALLFLTQFVLYSAISTSINIFIDEFSEDENVGSIRGAMLTITNFAAISAPFMSSQIFNIIGYSGIFVISALSLIPLLLISKIFFKSIQEPKYKFINLFDSMRIVIKNRNIRGVFVSSFVLNSFYAALNIYLALYLIKILNIPMVLYLEILVPITLIPFILIPYKLGKYADEVFGEKRPIFFGIILMSIIMSSIYIFNISTTNIFIWVALIFIARTGATITETGNYTYFYKGVDSRNAGLIAFFQNIVNLGSLFITILGVILLDLLNLDIKLIFLFVGLLGFLSLFIIIKIKDREIKRRKIEKINKDLENLLEKEKEEKNESKYIYEEEKKKKVVNFLP